MHIRTSTRKIKGKVYKYAQIMESYRGKDGLPTNRVVAHLGKRSVLEINNLKTTLRANSNNKTVVISDEIMGEASIEISANLNYLDLAVCHSLWKEFGLDQLVNRLFNDSKSEVPIGKIIAALTFQRCRAPDSKLYAERWFPTTALPEILDLPLKQFYNSRVHRALEQLERVEESFKLELAKLYQKMRQKFAVVYMDTTNAHFEGTGCELAQYAKTKNGIKHKKCIGIVLCCNEDGFPIQWEVVSGNRNDQKTMGEMVQKIKNCDWVNQIPIVCDRAMGTEKSIDAFLDSELHFLTSVPRNEIPIYTNRIPYENFQNLDLDYDDKYEKRNLKEILRVAKATDLSYISDDLLVLDLGICEKGDGIEAPDLQKIQKEEKSIKVALMKQALALKETLDSGKAPSQASLARKLGLSKNRVQCILLLTRLPIEIQNTILQGQADNISDNDLRRLCKMQDTEEQKSEFHRLRKKHLKKTSGRKNNRTYQPHEKSKVRLVIYFNPEVFLCRQKHAKEQLDEIKKWTEEFNKKLASPSSRRDEKSVFSAAHIMLDKKNMLEVFEIIVKKNAQIPGRFAIELILDEKKWKNKNRYDGFSLLIGSPELNQKAEDLVFLFRNKDKIEKDFQIIKSLIKLRPIYHRTDLKVRAHVSLCMLSLLIERLLEQKLKHNGIDLTADACLEILETCHLNLLGTNTSTYQLTSPTKEQADIISKLRLQSLISPENIAATTYNR